VTDDGVLAPTRLLEEVGRLLVALNSRTKSSARRAIVTSCAVVSKGLPECDYLPSIMNQGTSSSRAASDLR